MESMLKGDLTWKIEDLAEGNAGGRDVIVIGCKGDAKSGTD